MFRLLGKACRELWVAVLVIGVVIADMMGTFDGTWFDTFLSFAAILLFVWLILFAIGVSRGEPNP